MTADHSAIDLGRIATEQRNPATNEIDTMTTLDIMKSINAQDQGVAVAVAGQAPAIAEAVDAIVTAISNGGRLVYIGAGTSGRLGVLDASECPPTFNTDPNLVVGLIAGGDHALRHPIEQVEDDAEAGAEALSSISLGPADIVVGIAASGRTPYVLGALAYAKSLGAITIGLSNSPGSPVEAEVDLPITVAVGPEVITGSTRMKAGTAQKLVLNMLSTGAMIRLGKTYGNLMVDVQPTNAKLRRRAVRIVEQATGLDPIAAESALETSEGNVKVAIVSSMLGITADDALDRLDQSNGIVRRAIESETA